MNIVTPKIHAAPSASAFARAVLSTFAVCSVLAASLAHAQNQPPRRDDQQQQQQQMQAQRYEQVQRSNDTRLREQRDARSFDTRAEEQRRANDGAEASRRTGRMTPDERRDLRRQINEVGQDIYSNPPRR
ncbi:MULTISPECIES: hypothetical protein [unclassified Janthinobacterium]|uniref:hypothetical protein n=1 Tax=unclassified Janthinobacterium TaxID=2610881 RepID=UPI000AA6F514|nr:MULTISPECIES: hypothetical protein [unclassified Janthinobacterium]MDN2709237.1 hypothetical protein [Janthinobacterium sp. SUN118]